MEHYAINILGETQLKTLHHLNKVFSKYEIKLLAMESSSLGKHFSMYCLVACKWNLVDKFVAQLKTLQKKFALNFETTSLPEKDLHQLAYRAYVIAPQSLDTVHLVVSFFAEVELNINELSLENYVTHYSDVPMSALQLSISIPDDVSISDLRERFIIFCDNYNLDGILEPEKN